MNPGSFETSWTEAERYAFAKLCEATGCVPDKAAFLGVYPAILNTWTFTTDRIQTGGEVFWSPDCPVICLPARLDMVTLERAQCQKWAMSVIKALPWSNLGETNVDQLRVQDDGLWDIQPDYLEVKDSEARVRCFRLRMRFDLVFLTGGKENAAGAV